jgi:hypothetical protein
MDNLGTVLSRTRRHIQALDARHPSASWDGARRAVRIAEEAYRLEANPSTAQREEIEAWAARFRRPQPIAHPTARPADAPRILLDIKERLREIIARTDRLVGDGAGAMATLAARQPERRKIQRLGAGSDPLDAHRLQIRRELADLRLKVGKLPAYQHGHWNMLIELQERRVPHPERVPLAATRDASGERSASGPVVAFRGAAPSLGTGR